MDTPSTWMPETFGAVHSGRAGAFLTPSQRSRSQKDDAECDPLRSSDCHHGDRSYNRQRLALRERTQQLFPFRHHRWARSSLVPAVAFSGRLPALPAGVFKRSFAFSELASPKQEHVVLLADGGIYDNLGLSVLDPDGRERLPITCMTCHASSRVMPEGVSSAHRHLGSS